jgi:hypothetical protein
MNKLLLKPIETKWVPHVRTAYVGRLRILRTLSLN